MTASPRIAVLIPCYNEARTIATVIADFRRYLPEAAIWVCDNASDDGTGEIARQAGASVIRETKRGKGYAIRRLFREVEADLYLMTDGDSTYPAADAPRLLAPVAAGEADMVVGIRLIAHDQGSFRQLHKLGNHLITGGVNRLFGSKLSDVLSGYRVLSRRCVKSIPLISRGFEVETELTINTLDASLDILEIPIHYGARLPGSFSKLKTFADGFLIIRTLLLIFKDYRPLLFFTTLATWLALIGLIIGLPVMTAFIHTGLIEQLFPLLFAIALELLAFQMLGIGFILDTMTRNRRYQQELWIQSFQPRNRSRYEEP